MLEREELTQAQDKSEQSAEVEYDCIIDINKKCTDCGLCEGL